MAAADDYNSQLDSQITYQAYQSFVPPDVTDITGIPVGGAVTTIGGDSGPSAAGPVVVVSGGTTGYQFTAVGSSVTQTLSNAVSVRTSLEVARTHTAAVAPAVTDDGAAGYPVGSLWVDTVLQNGFMSVNASAGAAVWKQITV